MIRVNGMYYLYYGGGLYSAGLPVKPCTIGLATSQDGIHWTRANRGQPIISPAMHRNPGSYGSGQPTVSFHDGFFYMMYTDTTGAASVGKGSAQYVLRSKDPAFQTRVQELTATGFKSRTATNHTTYRFAPYISADMQYSDSLDSWIVAHSDGNDAKLSFFAPDLSERTFSDVNMPRHVVEGPGLVSRPDRHSVAPTAGHCGVVPVDIINATARPGAPTSLRRQGLDISAGQTCASMAPGKVAGIFDGYALHAPKMPLAFITGGQRLQSASAAPIQDLTKNFIATTSEVFHRIPYGASLSPGAKVIHVTGWPAAFLLDHNTKWPVSATRIVQHNKSSITRISKNRYDSYRTGPPLHAVW
ncbi:hypothetical protein [Streptomyces sp. AK02-04a]|uniref:hypothetical protein n=1 Tax=Streptomyces sp. AK02-04a TaxID=3028649 RepID=UPI0029BA3E8B|nr:hypothetical protein [Streptomyces sp. AK02-04a]MDX3764050.1 hypothetical protein [Streptomyces sp. AK02-04a]